MYSQVEICNLALDCFGSGHIVSINEDTEPANLLRNVWDSCRRSLLAKGWWNFATTYTELSETADTVYHPYWQHIYSYPTKCIKVMRVYSVAHELLDKYYEQTFEVFLSGERRYIGCNIADAKAQAVYDVENTSLYPPEFVTCLAYYLASRVCEALTRNGQIVQEMNAQYEKILMDAQLTNARERMERTQYPDAYLRFRNGRTGGWR